MPLAEAVRRLEAANIKRKLNTVRAPQWPTGSVIDQSPTPGSRLPASTVVELTISE
jgi:beta-lactam-binding protein with PASTA domain